MDNLWFDPGITVFQQLDQFFNSNLAVNASLHHFLSFVERDLARTTAYISEIRIGHAIRVLDGPLAPIRCASRTAYEACEDCADPETCQVRRAMTDVRDAIASILDTMSLEQFVAVPGAAAIIDEDELEKRVG